MKRLRELFIRAGLQTSDAQWRLQAEAAVNNVIQDNIQNPYAFDTLYQCRMVSFLTFVHICDLL